MWSISLTVLVVINVTLERQNGTFAQEHASTDKDSAIYNHFRTCTNYNHLKGLFNFENDSFNEIQFDTT